MLADLDNLAQYSQPGTKRTEEERTQILRFINSLLDFAALLREEQEGKAGGSYVARKRTEVQAEAQTIPDQEVKEKIIEHVKQLHPILNNEEI